ncbi:MAG: hypothetical protein ACOYVD_02275 [Bacillota bacterium]
MNKIDIQPYQAAKKYKCNLCDRLEIVEKRMVIWHRKQVVGDLLLCNSCLQIIQEIISGEEQVIKEFDLSGGD